MRRLILAAILLLGLPALAFAATGTVAPFPKHFFVNSTGSAPCASCKLFSYVAGTTTKENTYSDAALSSANTNPIVLDAAGRTTIFLTPGVSYKFVLTTNSDTDPPASPIWTVDSVTSVPAANVDVDVTGTAGEALSASDVVYLSAGDGGRTAGRWYKADADLDYGSVTAQALGYAVAAISSGSSGAIRTAGRVTGLAGLSTGTTYYISATAGSITGTPPTNARKVGIADSATSVITSSWLSPADASATLAGIVSTGTQTFAGAKTFSGNVTIQGDTVVKIGNGTETAYPCGVIEINTTSVGNVGAGTDDLMTYTLPANTLSRNGQELYIYAFGQIAGADAARTVDLSFGGTTLQSATTLNGAVSSGYTMWHIEARVIRTGTAAQRYVTSVKQDYGSSALSGTAQGNTSTGTLTKDETTALTIKVQGSSANSTNDDVVQRVMAIRSCN